MTETSAWPPQDGAGLLNLNGVLYLLGGWAPGTLPDPFTHSRVYRSFDGGRTWERLADAPWEGRHTAGWVVHNNKIFVVGGDMNKGHYQRDIWCGTPNAYGGIDWVLVNANATPLSDGRALHQVYSHAGKLWIVGGQTLDEFTPGDISTKPGSPFYDDVWSSDDEGVTWVLVSIGNAWAPCGLIINPGAVKDGHMWLVAGGTYDTEGNTRVYKNSVWKSTDGEVWTLVTADAGFPARQYHSVIVRGDELVIIAGYNGSLGNLSDVWTSNMAGDDWTQKAIPPWQARHAASACNFNGSILWMCGPLDSTSVWAMY